MGTGTTARTATIGRAKIQSSAVNLSPLSPIIILSFQSVSSKKAMFPYFAETNPCETL